MRRLLLFVCLAACQASRLAPAHKTPVTPGSSATSSGIKRATNAPCNVGSDCESGYCVTANGKQACTARCADDSDCVGGLVCKRADGRDPTSPLVCAPQSETLCQPCTQDTDCGPLGDLCLTGKDGNACARDCTVDGTCPDGYTCEPQTDSTGAVTGQQCMPTKQSCSCNDATRGKVRACAQSNAFGTCPGTEVCNPDIGFVGCTAAVPTAEVCDGIDNNCNGVVDEQANGQPLTQACGNGNAPCVGVETCKDGQFSGCTAATPQPEVCNGIDDDCNGQIDDGLVAKPDSCGACGNVCPPGAGYDVSTQRQCVNSGGSYQCGPFACIDPYYDVDGDPANGCELRDDLPMHTTQATALAGEGSLSLDGQCSISDWNNSHCEIASRMPADKATHVTAPTQRDGPTKANGEEWFVFAVSDDDFAVLDVRARIDVSAAPAQNIYEMCMSVTPNDVSFPGCGSPANSEDLTWCNGKCCCAHGGFMRGVPEDLDTGSDGDDSGNYFIRVRWVSGTAVSSGDYSVRMCDDSGDHNCD